MTKRLKPASLELVVRNPSQLGAAFLRFRKLDPQTQQLVGERAGIKQALISRIENGMPGTSLETIFRALAGLDLELVVRKRRKTSIHGTQK